VNHVRQCMQDAVGQGVFPGAVLLVAENDHMVLLEAFGQARLYPSERPMRVDTVFDLASLTKPLATTLSAMILVQNGAIELDQKLAEVISDFTPTEKRNITIRELLSHASGLPAYRPFYEELRDLGRTQAKRALRQKLLDEPLAYEPGGTCLYSDLGFMILEWAIEVASGRKLNEFTSEEVYTPFGLHSLFFNALPRRKKAPYAATEDCPWRGKILEGEVHDDNAYVVGGVAGHAGLFGTAQSVYRLLLVLLHTYRGTLRDGIFSPETVEAFFTRQYPSHTWALGFDTPSPSDSSSGRHFSERSVGHLGFTGTSFWMDLDKQVVVVLLTNRVHPGRNNDRIKRFRPLLHDTVMKTLQA